MSGWPGRVGLGLLLLLLCGGAVQAFVPWRLQCLPSAAPVACSRRHCRMSSDDARPGEFFMSHIVYTGDLRTPSKPPMVLGAYANELLAEQDAVERTLLWVGGRGLASALAHDQNLRSKLEWLAHRMRAGEVGTVAEVRDLIRRETAVDLIREFRERLTSAQESMDQQGSGTAPRRFWAVSRIEVVRGEAEGMGPESDGEVLTLEAMKAALKGGQSL
jgi:hypothetical protein